MCHNGCCRGYAAARPDKLLSYLRSLLYNALHFYGNDFSTKWSLVLSNGLASMKFEADAEITHRIEMQHHNVESSFLSRSSVSAFKRVLPLTVTIAGVFRCRPDDNSKQAYRCSTGIVSAAGRPMGSRHPFCLCIVARP